MVCLVRAGMSIHAIAEKLGISLSTVSFWVERAKGARLDRVDFSGRKSGFAWNRLATSVEQRIAELRKTLREDSVLGEYGAHAIGRGAPHSPPATAQRLVFAVGGHGRSGA